MNPIELQKLLAPILGEEVARALAVIAQDHKQGAEFKVSVRSGVLVQMAEALAARALS